MQEASVPAAGIPIASNMTARRRTSAVASLASARRTNGSRPEIALLVKVEPCPGVAARCIKEPAVPAADPLLAPRSSGPPPLGPLALHWRHWSDAGVERSQPVRDNSGAVSGNLRPRACRAIELHPDVLGQSGRTEVTNRRRSGQALPKRRPTLGPSSTRGAHAETLAETKKTVRSRSLGSGVP